MRPGSTGTILEMLLFNWLKGRRNQKAQPSRGLLGRLRRDQRGATLAMMAASIIPMVGIVGSAVDMSRAYLVKTRLQQACDAGALAARRVMVGSALDANARTQGNNFFNINLAQGAYGATNITIAFSDVLDNGRTIGVVQGDATADVPTTLMRIFGKTEIEMTAQCEAQLNVANNDIMFVLDVTGSMACLPSDSSSTCSTYAGSSLQQNGSGIWHNREKAGSRIDGLRDAVKDFFNTVRTATSNSSRLRVGFVPFSSGVRVGPLLLAGVPNSLSTGSIEYQSRKANFATPKHTPAPGTPSGWTEQTYGSKISSASCTNYGANQSFSGFTPSPAGNPAPAIPTAVITGGATPAPVVSTEYRFKSWADPSDASGNKTCKRESRTVTSTYTTRYAFTSWIYEPESFDVTTYATGVPVNVADATTGTVASIGTWNVQQLMTLAGAQDFTAIPHIWDGCIEDRLTGNADYDNAPSSAATRFRPAWEEMEFLRTSTPAASGSPATGSNYSVNYSCPKAATRLAEMTQGQVTDYVEGPDFLPHGQTYHDIGMIWGVRLMSPNGMFSADHGPAPNGKPVNRHIIFMTDGDMDPSLTSYSTYGIENLDRRVMPTGTLTETNLAAVHNTRFLAACQAAKDRGISVWTVGFATTLTSQLTACADPNQAFAATSTAELRSRFQTIAQRIAELRLSK
jgi:Flp pilus assembly protein TadG